jgi:hypothetical protein
MRPTPLTTLYLLAPCRKAPPNVVRELRRLRAFGVRLRVLETLNDLIEIHPRSIVVLDLLSCRRDQIPLRLDRFRGVELILLLDDTQTVPVGWLDYVAARRVETITTAGGTPTAYSKLAAMLRLRVERRRRGLVPAVVRRLPPPVDKLADLVHHLLRDPWAVRRPRDIAVAAGISYRELKQRCADAGLERTEHLITVVRWLAFEHLTNEEHLDRQRALDAVGVGDRSNFRKQVQRAGYLLGRGEREWAVR